MATRDYRELITWQKAMDLVQVVYEATREFPGEERFGLVNQLRRAAVSVPSNIAEGQGRRTTREFLHHLSIARGSLCEVETQLLIAARLEYLSPRQVRPLMDLAAEVGRLVNDLHGALNDRLTPN